MIIFSFDTYRPNYAIEAGSEHAVEDTNRCFVNIARFGERCDTIPNFAYWELLEKQVLLFCVRGNMLGEDEMRCVV